MQNMDEIYKQYAKMVYHYLLSLTGNEQLAEELTQETFYQAIRCINKFDESCKISTWLCAIGKRQYLAYCKKNKNHLELSEKSITQKADSAESIAISNTGRVDLLKKLHDVKEPVREVLYLRIFGNLSFCEIGEVMGRTENWARVTFYRGKERIAKVVNEHEL